MAIAGAVSKKESWDAGGPEFAIVQPESSVLGLLLRALLETHFPGATIEPSDEFGSAGVVSIENRANGRVVRVYTVEPAPAVVLAHWRSSGCSLLTFDSSLEELSAGFDSLMAGPRFVSASLAPLLEGPNSADRPRLTSRELEVIRLLGGGLSNQEIARQLAVSPHTVRSHLQSITARLGVNSRGKLVARARDLGLF